MADVGLTIPPRPTEAPAQGSDPNAAQVAQSKQAPKRNPRHRKNPSQSLPQFDGTVSDSVTNTMASPRAKKTQKPKHQSVAMLPNENTNMSNANGHNPRHASAGGNMIPATPFKEQAYAGPTFQASPAPSSLPVPKFFSRSVPSVAAPQSFEARMADEKGREGEQSSPESDSATPPSRASQQSPLDLLFNADRAEKDKYTGGNRLSPEAAARRPPATEPRIPFQQSGKSISLREADGDEGPLISPKTVPPNNRRSQTYRASSLPGSRQAETDSESEREAFNNNLKDMLLNSVNGTPPSNSAQRSNQRPHTSARPVENAFETPSPFQRSASGPSTPAPFTDQQNQYSLHYGNRNLSPLFKAARSETPPRPSSLRQQESASEISAGPNNYPGGVSQPRQTYQIDPNSFSRNYLDNTIRHSQPTLPPNLPVNVHQTPASDVSSGHFPAPQQGVPATGASPRAAAGGGNANDIKTMEDDLRRMLKLNVLSN